MQCLVYYYFPFPLPPQTWPPAVLTQLEWTLHRTAEKCHTLAI
jgi:hypothetical protein